MNKTFAAMAAGSLLGAVAGCSVPPVEPTVRPDISYLDGTEEIDTNPARGRAGGGWKTFSPDGLPKWHGSAGYHSSLWELSRFSGGREERGKRPKPERVGTADIPITDAMKSDVRRFLEETREKGGTLIVRLGYTWSDQKGCEPDDFDVALGHVRDLSEIMRGYEDVVVGVEAGIAGPWGEMHSSEYCKPEYMNRILRTYIDNLGERIPVLVRAPGYFNKLAETNTVGLLEMLPFKDKYLRRLGMYNDGYLGTWWDYGTWAGDFKRERGCQLLNSLADAPYGGEMAYINRDWLDKNMKLFQLEHWNIVKDWYEVHLNYLRNISERGHTLAKFLHEELTFDSKAYAFEGMPSLSEYDGTKMGKFLMDHMGYRFVVRDALIPSRIRPGRENRIALDIENTGFGKLLLAASAEVVMVKDGAETAVPAAFDLDIGGGRRERRIVSFTPETVPEGAVDVYLRVKADRFNEAKYDPKTARTIRFANAGMWNADLRANRLGSCGK